MRISTKLKLNAVLVLLLLVVNATVGIYFVQRMTGDVRQLTEVEEAVLEMEINAGETARAVLDYIRDHEERDIDKMHDSEADFERFAKEFERLAETDKERELGRRVAELYRDFKTLGDEIVSLAKRRNDNLVVFRKDVTRIDELIDEKLQPAIDRSASDALDKLEAALDMEINIAEAFGAIEGYVLGSSPELRLKITDSEEDFKRFEAQYRGTRLSANEEKWLDLIEKDFAEAVIAGNEIVAFTDQLHEKLEKFEADLEEIDRILDDEVQVLIHEETMRAAKDAERSGKITIAFMIVGGLLLFATVAGVGWFVSKGIIDATSRLSQGAAEFSRGNLDHRIEARTNDELGALAGDFNKMADRRRSDEEALRLANLDLEKRVQERTESIRQSERRTREILTQARDCIITIDTEAGSSSSTRRQSRRSATVVTRSWVGRWSN